MMLDHSEIDIEVLNTDIEIIESDGYKGVSETDRDINGMLAIMWEKVRFSH